MQLIFGLHGNMNKVKEILDNLHWTYFNLPIYDLKTDKKIQTQVVQGVVRLMPLGLYSYHFPKEYLDQVLNALRFPNKHFKYTNSKYNFLFNFYFKILRKALKLKKIPNPDEKKGSIPNVFTITDTGTNALGIGIIEDKDNIDEKQNIRYEGL